MLCVTSAMAVSITKTQGWFESGCVEWAWEDGATYTVFVRPEGGSYTQLDKELVRHYPDYGRADMVGLKAGKYQFKVVSSASGEAESSVFYATAHDRSGFAHVGMPDGIGAYKNDGTLKDGAKVIYITAKTAKTVHMDVKQDSKGSTISCTGFQTIIDAYQKGYETTPVAFRIIGKVAKEDLDKMSSSAEGIQVKGKGVYSNMPITIEGIGNDATVQGFGFLVRNTHNAEFRNFAIMVCLDDCLSLDTGNSNVWIHNMDFFYGGTGGDADQAKGDGTVDVKGKSMKCTISYNHFYDNGKTSLGGMEGSTAENGCWHTYHHNWFDHSDSRHPRIRSQFFHVYNNFYDGVSKYGVGAAAGGASAFVEKNYFRNTKYPVLSSLQGTDAEGAGTFSGETGGVVKVFDNIYSYPKKIQFWTSDVQATGKWDAYNAQTRDEQVPTECKSFSGNYPYNYEAEKAALSTYIENKIDYADEVPTIVRGELGAGRMQHGDFNWRFKNANQDENYSVIPELKAAVVAYESTLIGFADGTKASDRTPAEKTVVGGDGQDISDAENEAHKPSWAGGGGSTASGKQVVGENGDYFWFNAANASALAEYNTDGIITTTDASVVFDKDRVITNSTYGSCSDYIGSYKVPQNQGVIVYDAKGIATANFYVSSAGSQSWQLYTSKDGSSWTASGSKIEGKKGTHPTAIYTGTDATIKYVKIVNTNSSTRDVQGVKVYQMLTPSDLKSLVNDNIAIKPGKTLQLTKGVHYTTSCTGDITFKSSITRLVTVSETGLVTGLVEGKSTVSLIQSNDEVYNGGSISFVIEVGGDDRAESDLKVTSPAELTIVKGATSQITATASSAITYTSSAPSIASVDASGVITAKGYGKAIITVASAGNDDVKPGSATITVTVPDTRAASALAVAESEVNVERNQTSQIIVTGAKGNVKYESDDETIATVSADGVITAVAQGEASILVSDEGDDDTTAGKVYVSVNVTDSRKANPLTVTPTEATIEMATATTLQLTVAGAEGDVTYTTANANIATVSNTGLITGAEAGTTTITVSAAGNDSYLPATVEVSVKVVPVPSGDPVTWDLTTVKSGTTFAANADNYFISTDNSKSELLYVGGSSCKIDRGEMKMGGKTGVSNGVLTNRYFKLPALSGSGKITVVYGSTVTDLTVTKSTNTKDATATVGTITSTSTTLSVSGLNETVLYIYAASSKAYLKSITWTPDNKTSVNATAANGKAINAKKFMKKGKVLIVDGEKKYNAGGAEVE